MATDIRHAASGSQVRQRIVAAQAGSADALGELLEGCREYLTLVARAELDSRLRVKNAPSDLVQETFIEARRAFGEFAGHTLEELTAWLRQILLFKLSGSRRRFRWAQKRDVRREISLAGDDSRCHAAEALIAPDSRSSLVDLHSESEELHRALLRLTEDHQQVIRLRHWEGLGFDEIGRRMNRSAVASQRLWARAVRRLREEVEGDERD